jgi:hypothetical protein
MRIPKKGNVEKPIHGDRGTERGYRERERERERDRDRGRGTEREDYQ